MNFIESKPIQIIHLIFKFNYVLPEFSKFRNVNLLFKEKYEILL